MNTKTTAKDFFLHLGATIALYAGTIALINLFFTIVNKALPDALSYYFSAGSIVWPISMIVVLVPILYVIEWQIGRDIARMPEKKDLWIRVWRIYLTLFLTGATIVGDLIALINTYLNGEISARFIWKVIIVLVVSMAVFKYYLFAKNMREGKWKTWRTMTAWWGIVLAAGAVISGFAIVGSPAAQRAQRFDAQRVNDLTMIQYDILSYWQRTGTVPAALASLNDPLSGTVVSVDPETGAAYEYSVKGPQSFELCATFSRASEDAAKPSLQTAPLRTSDAEGTWSHPAGRYCFERTIDAVRYPVNPQSVKPIK